MQVLTQQVRSGACDSAFPTSSQGAWMLLVHGPYREQPGSKL